jgi:uncharacterized protein (TIGR03546 family)
MLRMVARLLKALNSEAAPVQISLALCLAMVAGLTPLASPHNFLVLLAALIIRVNLSAFILGIIFFSGLAYLLDPFFGWFGSLILTSEGLRGLWTWMYNITLFRLMNFNNTILMGSLVFSLLISVPFIPVVNRLIQKYREHVLAWVERTHLMQAFKASKLYRLYRGYVELGGG